MNIFAAPGRAQAMRRAIDSLLSGMEQGISYRDMQRKIAEERAQQAWANSLREREVGGQEAFQQQQTRESQANIAKAGRMVKVPDYLLPYAPGPEVPVDVYNASIADWQKAYDAAQRRSGFDEAADILLKPQPLPQEQQPVTMGPYQEGQEPTPTMAPIPPGLERLAAIMRAAGKLPAGSNIADLVAGLPVGEQYRAKTEGIQATTGLTGAKADTERQFAEYLDTHDYRPGTSTPAQAANINYRTSFYMPGMLGAAQTRANKSGGSRGAAADGVPVGVQRDLSRRESLLDEMNGKRFVAAKYDWAGNLERPGRWENRPVTPQRKKQIQADLRTIEGRLLKGEWIEQGSLTTSTSAGSPGPSAKPKSRSWSNWGKDFARLPSPVRVWAHKARQSGKSDKWIRDELIAQGVQW